MYTYGTNILMNFDYSVDFSLTYYLLTVASFRIGVNSILFPDEMDKLTVVLMSIKRTNKERQPLDELLINK